MSAVPANLVIEDSRVSVEAAGKRSDGLCMPTANQLWHLAVGAVASGWCVIPDHHPANSAINNGEGGVVVVKNLQDVPVEVHLGKDFGAEIEICVPYARNGKGVFRQRGRWHYQVTVDGITEHFRYFGNTNEYACHRLGKDVCKAQLGGSILQFSSKGIIAISIKESINALSVYECWSETLEDGSPLLCDGEGHLLHARSGRAFRHLLGKGRWQELFIAVPSWTFQPLGCSENTTEVDVLGLIVLNLETGAVRTWNTTTYTRFQEIDDVLVGDDGACLLWVHREAGSDYLYFHEDGSEEPTGACHFAENYYSKERSDQIETFNAWLFSACCDSVPFGDRGTNPLGTLLLSGAFVLGLIANGKPAAGVVLAGVASAIFVGKLCWDLFMHVVSVVRA